MNIYPDEDFDCVTSDLVSILSVQKAGSKADVVQMCGAVVEWTTEKSSRKNVFQVTNKQTGC